MDSDARRSLSGNSNHRIQNYTPELLSKIKSQKRSRKKNNGLAIRKDSQGKNEQAGTVLCFLEPCIFILKKKLFPKRNNKPK